MTTATNPVTILVFELQDMRNKLISHKKIFCVLLSLFIGGGASLCFALQEEIDAQEEPSNVSVEAQEDSAQTPASESAEEESKSEPATRFTPTEKIRAADTISLPVDI